MTKEEIKTLISAKIAGQGNQVDSGGALDEILKAIVDSIPEGGGVDIPEFVFDESRRYYITEEQYGVLDSSPLVKVNGELFVKVVATSEMAEGLVSAAEHLQKFSVYINSYWLNSDGDINTLRLFSFQFTDVQDHKDWALAVQFIES